MRDPGNKVEWISYPIQPLGEGRRGTCSVHMIRDLTELNILNPKTTRAQKFTPRKNFLPQNIQDLNISVLIYSIKQTLLMHDIMKLVCP